MKTPGGCFHGIAHPPPPAQFGSPPAKRGECRRRRRGGRKYLAGSRPLHHAAHGPPPPLRGGGAIVRFVCRISGTPLPLRMPRSNNILWCALRDAFVCRKTGGGVPP